MSDDSKFNDKCRALSQEERREMEEILEHLVVVGNAWRHHHWRIAQSQWQRKPKNQQPHNRHPKKKKEETTTTPSTSTTTMSMDNINNNISHKKKRPRLVYPRDEREYKSLSTATDSARIRRLLPRAEQLHRLDEAWDAACFGDGFVNASSWPYSSSSSSMLSLQGLYDNEEVNPAAFDACRVSILRSWERALTLASQTIPVTISTIHSASETESEPVPESESKESESKESEPEPEPEPAPESPEQILLPRQTSTHLPAPPLTTNRSALARQLCQLLELDQSDHGSAAWIAIRKQQRVLICQALTEMAQQLPKQTLQSLQLPHHNHNHHHLHQNNNHRSSSDPINNYHNGRSINGSGDNDDMHDNEHWSWQYVLSALENLPLPNRRAALDAALRRLVERYANVPR